MTKSFESYLEEELRDPESARYYGEAQAKSSFALTLANARLKAGLTQEELAEKAGVSQAYIAKLEGGEANPTLGRIGSLLAVMGLSLVTDVAELAPRTDTSDKNRTDQRQWRRHRAPVTLPPQSTCSFKRGEGCSFY